MQDVLKDELAEVQQQLSFEKEEKSNATTQSDNLRSEIARISSELEALKASGVTGEGDMNDLRVALEDKAAKLSMQLAKAEELDHQVGLLASQFNLTARMVECMSETVGVLDQRTHLRLACLAHIKFVRMLCDPDLLLTPWR